MNIFLNYLGYYISNISLISLNISETSSFEELLKSDSNITPAELHNYLFWLIRIFWGMVIVIIFFILLHTLRKYLNKTNLSFFDKKKNIEVLSTAYLGPKKSICIVRIESEIFVLGVTPHSINFITKLLPERITEEKNLKYPSEKPASESQPSENINNSKDKDFEDVFESMLSETDKVEIDENTLSEEFDGEKTLLENIKKLKKTLKT